MTESLLKNDSLCGRSPDALTPGTEVLMVTCPAMVYALLRRRFENDPEKLSMITMTTVGLMDAVQANPEHGVFLGKVTEAEDAPSAITGFRVSAERKSGALPVIASGDELKELRGPRPGDEDAPRGYKRGLGDGLLAMMTSGLGLDEDGFEKAHPWLHLIGLTDDERNQLLLTLGDYGIEEQVQNFSDEDFERLVKAHPELEGVLDDEENGRQRLFDAIRADMTQKPSERFYLVYPSDIGHVRYLGEVYRSIVGRLKAEGEARERAVNPYL